MHALEYDSTFGELRTWVPDGIQLGVQLTRDGVYHLSQFDLSKTSADAGCWQITPAALRELNAGAYFDSSMPGPHSHA
jgi:hypothetical protein